MAEGRRRRRGPQGKVATQDNVLRVNLDLRSGLPRATLQPNPGRANGACTTGLGGAPQYYSAYCRPPPAQHSYQAPAQHSYQAPAQHSYQAPAQHSYQAPAQHSYQAPAQHSYQAPAQHSYQAPAQHSYQAPAQHSYQAPAQHSYQAPAQHSYQAPAQHSYQAPTQHNFQAPRTQHNYQAPAQHSYQAPRTQHLPPTTQYREVLDEPPKYDDIFRNNLNVQPSQPYAGQHKSYEKSHLKSYLLRHFNKAKTVNKDRGAPVVTRTVGSRGSVGVVTGGRSPCYAEVNIPPTTPLQCPRSSPVGGPPSPHPHLAQPTYEQHNQFGQQPFLRRPQQQPRQQEFGQQQQQHSGQQQFEQQQQQQFDQFGYQQNQQQTKKFTITLKPGHYQVNVEWRSKSRPFSITLTPKKKASFEAQPPTEQQPLYYATCPAPDHHNHHFSPRRIVHRLLFGPHSHAPLECDQGSDDDTCDENMSPAQLPRQSMQQTSVQQQVAQHERRTLQQQVGINPRACEDRKGQKRCWNGVSPRHRQRKSRYRWASLSCMHLGSLDDSVGETSGGDSYGGYEGVEHLKRHSLSHARAASCESLACRCRAVTSTAGSGLRSSLGNYGVGNMRRRGVAALGVSARLNSLHSAFYGGGPGNGDGGPHGGDGMDIGEGLAEESFIFVEKPQVKYEAVSCEVLRNDDQLGPGELLSKIQGIVSPSGGERKTWHEDEAFVKQVVEEYFKDPAPLSDSEVKEAEVTLPPAEPKAADENFLGDNPADLHKSSSSSSSSSMGSASCSSSSDEAEDNPQKGLDGGSPSIDTTYCDTDNSNSWFTDDSEGYEADAEPSDKDTLGQMWRRWRSAPDVRLPSDVRARLRGQQLGQAAAAAAPLGGDAAYSSGVSATKNGGGRVWRGEGGGVAAWGGEAATHAAPYKHLPVCGYQTRKSCSVDETKLSRLRLGLRKVKEHKLLQFPQHDLERRRRPSKVQSSTHTERERVGGSEETLIPALTTPDKEDVDDNVFTTGVQNLEFVNGKFKAGEDKIQCREGVWECARASVGKVGVQADGGGCGGCRESSVDGGASVDDSTTERTHRVLSQGLVVHHSAAVHDTHSILNASVIKNALSILREGIAAQELETTKSESCASVATSGEKSVPSEAEESGGTHTQDTQVEDEVQVGCSVAEGERIIVASVNLRPTEDTAFHDAGQLEHQHQVGSRAEELEGRTGAGSGEQDHTEVASVDLVQDKEMNRSNITIHLTPPLTQRTNKDKVKPTVPQSLAAKEQPFIGWGKTAGKVNDSLTYQNVQPCDRSNSTNGNQQVGDGVSSGSSQRVRMVPEADPSPRSSSVDTTRRSIRTSSEWRASTDTLSSSSGTSSCCHTRPKPKSKMTRKSFPQSPGHSRRRQTAADGSSGTTSSASIKVFGNEFQLHRVQVGTGSDRKFAQATQRAVFEVPVSGGEQSDSQTLLSPPGENKQGSGGATVQKSELVLEPPQFRESQGGRRKHPPTFLSSSFPNSKICVSEYNIGDAQPAPESPRLLAHEFKLSNIDERNEEVTRKSNKGSGKSKSKSKPRKYFSGILNAIGSAAPRLRGVSTGDNIREKDDDGGLVVSECGVSSPRPHALVYDHPAPCSGVVSGGCKSSASQGSRPPTATSPGGEGRSEPHAAISSKPEVIQVRAHTKDSSKYDISNDVVPVPSPRPRRALKNSRDLLDNVATPTPPTRRRNTEESANKTIINEGSKKSGECFESPRASPRASRGREPSSESVERNFRCNLPTTAHHLVQTNTNTDAYENLTFHEKHSFGKCRNPSASEINCNIKELSGVLGEAVPQTSTKYSSLSQGSDSHWSKQSRSRSAGAHATPGGEGSDRAQQESCGGSKGESSNKHGNNSESGRPSGEAGGRAVAEGHSSGSGSNNRGSTTDTENAPTHTSDARDNGEMNGSHVGVLCDEWSRVSGRVEGGTINKINPFGWHGADSGSSTPARRRRARPPSLPTTPPQFSRARRTSQSSATSGGSLPSSPTRWRRPQAEDTWEDSSVDGSHEGRLSNSPSAESVASESTSFYYSAAGSVNDRPKSFNDDTTARYSFVTCPQYEALTPLQETTDGDGTPAPVTPVKRLDRSSTSNISRTISGDLNCDVDVSLSEGEIKIRVRTDDEDVISSTSIHDDDSDNDTDSDCDEYELCSDIKTLEDSRECDSPEMCNSTCESEDDALASGGDVVHAVPCVAEPGSSNRSSVSSSSIPTFRGRYLDSLSSQEDSRKRESPLVHATPCWATTDSDVRSSVSSSDYYGKVYLSATPEEKVYVPEYENLEEEITTHSSVDDTRVVGDEDCTSEPKTQKRRLSGVWTTAGDTEDVSSEWEEETLSTDKCLNNVSISDSANEEAAPHVSQLTGERHPEYHEPAQCSTLDEEFIPEEVHPLSSTPQFHRKSPSVDESERSNETEQSDCTTDPQNGTPGWEQHTAAWEWHKTMWEHHQHLHQQHLYHLRQHHQHHQSLLADVMSCLGGRWGMGGGSWSHPQYPDSAGCPEDVRCAHLQHTPTPDSRWSGQLHDDPPYRPASAASDLGKPPPSPLPPSGSHRSRDTSSVPREGSRPQSRQKSRSRRRAHSANSKYRVELEIPPQLFSRPRPSSFSSLATRRPSSQSPEPLEDDLRQEALLYLSEAAFDRSVDASLRRYCCVRYPTF
nr:uncharacterized protein LOC123748700 [Procambarus clarkii]XP_045586805.1 uncharacterized protein LOC123748700 [Procambarus clarkii]XP_045586806.1 uncharacterized protein LOC123748700 [Procambarus clarkii]XP_045586807.1 uncharacterized protein LOC123748700 [Procambarus clarkii]XP_045586808.1 uncharacterized protein LOC123748700 [Procambarus clarkii]